MEPYIGEIRAVSFSFAPQGWALCQGQLLPITQNVVLYTILGITYGGDGRSTFALPNLQGRLLVQPGQGAGLSSYVLGQQGGTETVSLQTSNLPAHMHGLGTVLKVGVSSSLGTATTPTGNFLAATEGLHYSSGTSLLMAPDTVSGSALAVGGGDSHDNHMPYLALNYIIALQGVFPPRP